MKKISNSVQIIIGAIVLLAILVMIVYFPVETFVNSHYATAKECTVQSVEMVKSGSGRKVASRKMSVYVDTSDCGTIRVTKDSDGNQDIQKIAKVIEQKDGNKLTFMIGPLQWDPNNRSAESVILPK